MKIWRIIFSLRLWERRELRCNDIRMYFQVYIKWFLETAEKKFSRRKCKSSKLIEPIVKESTWLIPEKYFTHTQHTITSLTLLAAMNIFKWKYRKEERETKEDRYKRSARQIIKLKRKSKLMVKQMAKLIVDKIFMYKIVRSFSLWYR